MGKEKMHADSEEEHAKKVKTIARLILDEFGRKGISPPISLDVAKKLLVGISVVWLTDAQFECHIIDLRTEYKNLRKRLLEHKE